MLDSILASDGADASLIQILICTAASLVLGVMIAGVYMYRNVYHKSFVITIALLPVMVQSVIMVVNGNLGTGVAVMGAFGLVRFRSVPGSAREISSVFFAMAVGLSAGMGYLAYAALFTVIICAMMLLFTRSSFGEHSDKTKTLRIMIPEDLDYAGLFDDIFREFTDRTVLDRVRTTNLGGLYELQYTVEMKHLSHEKQMLDLIRQRNSNLSVSSSRVTISKNEL